MLASNVAPFLPPSLPRSRYSLPLSHDSPPLSARLAPLPCFVLPPSKTLQAYFHVELGKIHFCTSPALALQATSGMAIRQVYFQVENWINSFYTAVLQAISGMPIVTASGSWVGGS